MHSIDFLLNWIQEENRNTFVNIQKIKANECVGWIIDENIHRTDNSFFSIKGIKNESYEQPVLIQDEIGFLGIIAKYDDNGELLFLMQAKIEPGNINCVQISPTIQATKSNFTQKHGGKKPPFLEYFLNPETIIVDQLQSEQSSRFFKKRNRNMIVLTKEDIPESNKYKWISISQLKELMTYDNLVNMDTRTVLSCLPLHFMNISFCDKAFEKSVKNEAVMEEVTCLYNYINNYKMFSDNDFRICDLDELTTWKNTGEEIIADHYAFFKVCFYDITIEGREVKHWCQPLFEATAIATFGLIYCEHDGMYRFLVKAKPEIGCFDKIEIGPTVQIDSDRHVNNDLENKFFTLLNEKQGVKNDVLLSEEGGRFYHEQNRNVIIKVDEMFSVPDGYFWVSFGTLNMLTQVNNCLNIQLRNLLSLLRFEYEKN